MVPARRALVILPTGTAVKQYRDRGHPGDHFTTLEEPRVKVLAEGLQACLHRARASVASS